MKAGLLPTSSHRDLEQKTAEFFAEPRLREADQMVLRDSEETTQKDPNQKEKHELLQMRTPSGEISKADHTVSTPNQSSNLVGKYSDIVRPIYNDKKFRKVSEKHKNVKIQDQGERQVEDLGTLVLNESRNLEVFGSKSAIKIIPSKIPFKTTAKERREQFQEHALIPSLSSSQPYGSAKMHGSALKHAQAEPAPAKHDPLPPL